MIRIENKKNMSAQTPTSRPATTGQVPPAGLPTGAAGTPVTAPTPTGASGNAPTAGTQQLEQNGADTGAVTVSEEEWESERQLVSSLAKLQELEAKVRILAKLVSNYELLTIFRSTGFVVCFRSVFSLR